MTAEQAALVDIQAIAALFGGFDRETGELLLAAAESDISEWSEKLIAAWQSGDSATQQLARHSLSGVCANFGAIALLALCSGDLSGTDAVGGLRTCREATLIALREAASL